MNKLTRNNKAFTFIEVIIASAILIVVTLGIAHYLTSQKKITQKLSASSGCNELAQSLVSHIQAGEPNLHVRNFVPPIGAVGQALIPDKQHYTRPIAEKINGVWQYFPHQLNENIIHQLFMWARQKDSSGRSFCGTETEFNLQDPSSLNSTNYGGDISITDLFSNVTLPDNAKAYLKLFF